MPNQRSSWKFCRLGKWYWKYYVWRHGTLPAWWTRQVAKTQPYKQLQAQLAREKSVARSTATAYRERVAEINALVPHKNLATWNAEGKLLPDQWFQQLANEGIMVNDRSFSRPKYVRTDGD